MGYMKMMTSIEMKRTKIYKRNLNLFMCCAHDFQIEGHERKMKNQYCEMDME